MNAKNSLYLYRFFQNSLAYVDFIIPHSTSLLVGLKSFVPSGLAALTAMLSVVYLRVRCVSVVRKVIISAS
ncbi:hypothetical protein Barb4_00682 [Bacteroidales bacterium Barb4]|nr:hypothetical protein Barb4_00682 [Bacteroidales bacterium Barb4]